MKVFLQKSLATLCLIKMTGLNLAFVITNDLQNQINSGSHHYFSTAC
ncbi:hypothetical protein PAGA_b0362 [Pseudoalteromonas agarivorans DSM 14585]|uniref:Uncharacterized protein n=1 Tax=Pseudoalteromonas agarivorans DSM 14585 TaxID=1312369 RepID=A0ACA8E2B0_9GAMM|nr:hypothetical protein PAGA_b0362 [Pseudoalteromonas agarivorans DSM 14585]